MYLHFDNGLWQVGGRKAFALLAYAQQAIFLFKEKNNLAACSCLFPGLTFDEIHLPCLRIDPAKRVSCGALMKKTFSACHYKISIIKTLCSVSIHYNVYIFVNNVEFGRYCLF